MANDFPGSPIDQIDSNIYVKSGNRRIENVEIDFRDIPKYGDRNSVVFPTAFSSGFYDELVGNHLQGIQRLDDGEYFVYSGGVSSKKIGNLIFIKYTCPHFYPSQRKALLKGPVTSNMWDGVHPIVQNPQCDIYKLTEGDYWHVGGISAMGDVLIVPVEDDNKIGNKKSSKSRVLFVNVEDPANPFIYKKHIDRPGEKGGVASAIQLPGGKILCAVWADSDDPHGDPSKKHRLDFYLSIDSHVNSDYNHMGTIFYKDIANRPRHSVAYKYPAFQSLQFVQQDNGKIYMIGLFNTSNIGLGTNKAFLFRIDIQQDNSQLPDMTFIADHDFSQDDTFYNLMAAGGTYVNSYKELTVYGAPYRIWNRREINFAEFCVPMHSNNPSITHPEQARIELYSDPDYKGPHLKILGNRYTAIHDFDDFHYDGRRLDNAVSSAKFILPQDSTYKLYPKQDWRATPASKVKSLTGNGTVKEQPQFTPSLDAVASSSKYD